MKYFEGAITYSDLQNMTIPELLDLNNSAVRIEKETDKAIKEQERKNR